MNRTRLMLPLSVTACAAVLFTSSEAHGQLLGLNLRGDVGLKSGTQPPPGYYFALPLYYGNDYSGLRDHEGNTTGGGIDAHLNLLGAPAIAVTTRPTFFGATYGFQAVLPLSSSRLSIAQPDVTVSDGYGFTDIYVQPLQLGWRSPRVDSRFGYAFFAPTGSKNHSLDMWAHEISAGSTLYLDALQNWHLAATAFYEIHHKKAGRDLRVGDILTVEGGLGGSFLKRAANIGVAYVAQWKITNDSGEDFPALLPKNKSRVFGLGPELTVPVFGTGRLVGLFNARYVWEFGGRSTFEGETFAASFTLAQLNLP